MVHQSHFDIFIFQGKSCVYNFGRRFHVSKSLACTVFPCVEKMLSFGCVCSMKMGLLKRVSPVLSDQKAVNF